MRKLSLTAMAFILTVSMAGLAMARPSSHPTGVTVYDPEKAYNGYVLISVDYADEAHGFVTTPAEYFTAPPNFKEGKFPTRNPDLQHQDAYLMDMNGNVVKKWENLSPVNNKNKLLPDGNLLVMRERSKEVTEITWEGETVWNYKTNLGPHHYHARLDNGNTLILCFEKVEKSLNRNVVNETTMEYGLIDRKSLELEGDTIIEVNPEGEVVWSWFSSEHMELNRYHPTEDLTDWTHGNTASVIPENKWYDAGDTRFKPGNILYNPRHFNQFFIIDKESGKIVWESDKDFNHFGGFANMHEPHMIPKGYPGEGNILLFDNGLAPRKWHHDGLTIVYEIRPDTFEVVWRYSASTYFSSDRFFSKVKGSAYKLPNGNVLISEDIGGRAFQVRPDASLPEGGEIVWEYIIPATVARTSMYAYDYAPQLAALPKPKEMKVTGLDPIYFSVLPDELREDGKFTSYTPGESVVPTIPLPSAEK